ncbi:uncharacterized protein PHALS_13475 [Plasmopara halstedii]|uniref:Uncharacterized protein n=1 Tax=Plasmopara halstedii TaxID=4781 RepID=A0A0P1AP80_PLAHL|nr:uncharacterized protein PHALS_13475 [Plasmopara halstedii]CEG43268.1 hypothetical protein PHALS_13475 [Plasmopara halstedii]|eukprot:XP_024579637.1 hypothetical protein PHALS_13475 [Plasmopara halstedii]
MDQQQLQCQLQHFIDKGRAPPSGRRLERATNDVTDIRGAKPLLKNHMYVNKPHFYDPRDIKGSTSMELHPKSRNAGSDDRFKQLPIEGSTPRPSGFRTDRVVNPLEPTYKLPSFNQAPLLAPKFLRDSYNVADIEGTCIKIRDIKHPRDVLKLNDIAGAYAGWLPRHKREVRENPPRDILNVRDITNVDFKSSRVTNVLNPIYTVHGTTFSDDPLSRPQSYHPKREKPSYLLKTDDINGTKCADPATTVVAGIIMANRRNYRDTNSTSDICGAKADTLVHSIRSNRCVDPNSPQYLALDGSNVDASAISVGKSIIYANLAEEYEMLKAAYKLSHNEATSDVVSGVGNVGLLGSANRNREKRPLRMTRPPLPCFEGCPPNSAPVKFAKSKTDLTPAVANRKSIKPVKVSSSIGRTRTEQKLADTRRDEIQLVRELY